MFCKSCIRVYGFHMATTLRGGPANRGADESASVSVQVRPTDSTYLKQGMRQDWGLSALGSRIRYQPSPIKNSCGKKAKYNSEFRTTFLE